MIYFLSSVRVIRTKLLATISGEFSRPLFSINICHRDFGVVIIPNELIRTSSIILHDLPIRDESVTFRETVRVIDCYRVGFTIGTEKPEPSLAFQTL